MRGMIWALGRVNFVQESRQPENRMHFTKKGFYLLECQSNVLMLLGQDFNFY